MGPVAADVLAHNRRGGPIVAFIPFAGALGGAVLAEAHLVLSLVCFVFGLLVGFCLIYGQIRLARALTEAFGEPIRAVDLPLHMNPRAFDRWIRQRGLVLASPGNAPR